MPIKSLRLKIDNYDYVGREQRSCMKISCVLLMKWVQNIQFILTLSYSAGSGLWLLLRSCLGELIHFCWIPSPRPGVWVIFYHLLIGIWISARFKEAAWLCGSPVCMIMASDHPHRKLNRHEIMKSLWLWLKCHAAWKVCADDVMPCWDTYIAAAHTNISFVLFLLWLFVSWTTSGLSLYLSHIGSTCR